MNIYVNKNVKKDGNGTYERPFKHLHKALQGKKIKYEVLSVDSDCFLIRYKRPFSWETELDGFVTIWKSFLSEEEAENYAENLWGDDRIRIRRRRI